MKILDDLLFYINFFYEATLNLNNGQTFVQVFLELCYCGRLASVKMKLLAETQQQS